MSDTIFGNPGDQTPPTPPNQPPADGVTPPQQSGNPAESDANPNPYAHLLAGIQADDGRQKYSTVDEALASVPHAQKHIMDLTTQVKELEQKVNSASNIDDVLERIQSQQASQGQPPKQELDETKLAQLVEAQLTQRDKQQVQKANHDNVIDSLKTMFGEKAEEVYIAKAKELGTTVATLNTLAGASPKAVLAYFNSPSQSSSGFGTSDVNIASGFAKDDTPVDPMAQFRSSESELVQKWRAAASKIKV
jgi:hypothetical protein